MIIDVTTSRMVSRRDRKKLAKQGITGQVSLPDGVVDVAEYLLSLAGSRVTKKSKVTPRFVDETFRFEVSP